MFDFLLQIALDCHPAPKILIGWWSGGVGWGGGIPQDGKAAVCDCRVTRWMIYWLPTSVLCWPTWTDRSDSSHPKHHGTHLHTVTDICRSQWITWWQFPGDKLMTLTLCVLRANGHGSQKPSVRSIASGACVPLHRYTPLWLGNKRGPRFCLHVCRSTPTHSHTLLHAPCTHPHHTTPHQTKPLTHLHICPPTHTQCTQPHHTTPHHTKPLTHLHICPHHSHTYTSAHPPTHNVHNPARWHNTKPNHSLTRHVHNHTTQHQTKPNHSHTYTSTHPLLHTPCTQSHHTTPHQTKPDTHLHVHPPTHPHSYHVHKPTTWHDTNPNQSHTYTSTHPPTLSLSMQIGPSTLPLLSNAHITIFCHM